MAKHRKILTLIVITAIILLSTTNHLTSSSETQIQFDISVTVNLSHYWDESILGVRNDASASFDVNWDIIDTPPPPRGLISYFWHPEHSTTPVDLRKLSTSRISPSDNTTWEYTVIPVDISGEATISWNAAEISSSIPSASVHLLNEEGTTLANMLENQDYIIYMEAGVSYRFFIRVYFDEINIDVTLVEPENGADVEMPVTLMARVTDMESTPLNRVAVTFFVDDILIGSNVSDDNGYALQRYTGEPGEHCWSVNITQPGYLQTVIESKNFTFAGSNYSVHRFDAICINEVASQEILIVDTVIYLTEELPLELWWKENSSHTFEWMSPIGELGGSRYIWDSTTGSSTRMEGSLNVSGVDANVTASYIRQHYLTIESQYGTPSPTGGWINEGTIVSASVNDSIPQGTGARQLCTGWYGNGSVPPSGTITNVTFTVESPSFLGWTWRPQVKVTLLPSTGGYTDPKSGDYWRDSGTQFTVTAFPEQGFSLDHWMVDGVSTFNENPSTLNVDVPRTIEAVFSRLNDSDKTSEDRSPPDTFIDSDPDISPENGSVTFSWRGEDEGVESSQLLYSFILEGYSSEWSEWTRNTSIQFIDLLPGNYTLRVRTMDPAGNIDATPAVSHVNLHPVFTLTVVSDHGWAYGGGVYQDEAPASFGVSPLVVTVNPGMRYVFEGWISSSPNGYSGQASDVELKMRSDVTQTVVWRLEYLLTVESEIPIEGGGWIEEGSNVVIEAVVSRGGLLRKVFKGWEGDIVSDNERISFQMDGPKKIRGEWSTDLSYVYVLSVLIIIISAISFYWIRQ